MANPVPPRLSNTPPPLLEDESSAYYDEYQNIDEDFNCSSIEPSLPSTPVNVPETEQQLSSHFTNKTLEISNIETEIISNDPEEVNSYKTNSDKSSEYIENDNFKISLDFNNQNSENICDEKNIIKITENYSNIDNEQQDQITQCIEPIKQNYTMSSFLEDENLHEIDNNNLNVNDNLTSSNDTINTIHKKESVLTKTAELEQKPSFLLQTKDHNDFEIEENSKIEESINYTDELQSNKFSTNSVVESNSNDCSNIEFNADFGNFQSLSIKNYSLITPDLDLTEKNLWVNTEISSKKSSNDNFKSGIHSLKEEKINSECNSDDFGEFRGFTESKPFQNDSSLGNSCQRNISPHNFSVKSTLDIMFPIPTEENSTKNSNFVNIEKNHLIEHLQEIDSAKALEYQWIQSNVKHALIKSLGIDSRNILYGENWNSSIPKFATNLGFKPLEPIKSTKTCHIENLNKKIINKTEDNNGFEYQVTGFDVPAAKFDWDSSGLVNPLKGIKEILPERKTENICTTKKIDNSEKQQHEINETINSTLETDIKMSLSNFNCNTVRTNEETTTQEIIENKNIQICNEIGNTEITSPNFIPLKETHIFTPTKCENSVARRVTPNENQCSIDFDYDIAAAGIIINEKVVKKEYRDIEYNPKILATNYDDNIPNLDNNDIITDNSDMNVKNNLSSFIINPHLETSNNCETNDSSMSIISKNSQLEESQTSSLNYLSKAPLTINDNEKQIIKNSPTIDDEFTDFQCAPLTNTKGVSINNYIIKKKVKENILPENNKNEMILSPSILLPQAITLDNSPKINWPDPGITSGEYKNFENNFKLKNNINSSNQIIENKYDDDDWSEFFSVPISTNRLNKEAKSEQSNDDDWSEFVSNTPTNIKVDENINKWNKNSTLSPTKLNSFYQPELLNSSIFSLHNSLRQSKNNYYESSPSTFNLYENNNNNDNNYKSKDMKKDFYCNGHVTLEHNKNENIQDKKLSKNVINSVNSIPELAFAVPKIQINMSRHNSNHK